MNLSPVYHKINCICLIALWFFSLAGIVKAQQHQLIAEGAKLNLIPDQFSFTEGPAADQDGNVYFTDQPNNKIWKYSTSGKLSIFMHHAGRSNGMYFDDQGNLVTAADSADQLWSISPEKNVEVLVSDFEGHRLNGPNDLWVDPKGGIYFTDPYYQRDYWKRTEPDIEEQRVYYLDPNRKKVSVVVDDFKKPNGIIGTPDGKMLYISDIDAHKIYSYTINDDGHLSDKKLFATMSSDGMTIDSHGNVYLAGKGVSVFNKKGEKIKQISVPHRPANITFGGPHQQTLFITARTGVYTLQMKVKGVRW